ncbi:MAG: hypothetical protein IT287_07150 [Bdellovibrionaceae bacterium]|nr:hypothetical protein [Pseudobdellovibrionaceae bacterium]
MRQLINVILVTSLVLFSVQCSHTVVSTSNTPLSASLKSKSDFRSLASEGKDWIKELPGDGSPFEVDIKAKVFRATKNSSLTDDEKTEAAKRIAKYVGFLLHNYDDIHANDGTTKTEKEKAKSKIMTTVLERLFKASTHFILCKDLSDYACIEQTPFVEPSSSSRREDASKKLGEPVVINSSTIDDSVDVYFNENIMIPEEDIDFKKVITNVLAEKIKTEGKDAIYAAIYGMDDVTANDKRRSIGSMNNVYNAMIDRINSGVEVRAVFDHKGFSKDAQKPLIFSYVEPSEAKKKEKWILSSANDSKNDTKTLLDFQYSEGTQGLIRALASGATNDNEATGRVEYKNDGIMHNKFFIFKNREKLSVWTGTANISRTCMGSERNSNMSVFVRNNEIAQTFLDEFNEMYEYQNPYPANKGSDFVGAKSKDFPYGLFHSAKSPNTKRYFHFAKDGSAARVYFSPTDDAEHRSILQMLHSAKEGDTLRVSMFGAAGVEYVRALQLAAARGVVVEIIVDSPTACGPGSWASKVGDATLLEKNPFKASASIKLKKNKRGPGSSWKQNHQKIGLLMRGRKAEQLVFGSQNWSSSGNDKNDENLMALTKLGGSLKIAEAFNVHFTDYLWPVAVEVPQSTGCKKEPGDEESEEGE